MFKLLAPRLGIFRYIQLLARPEGKLSAITISTGREEDFPSNSNFWLEFGEISSSNYIFKWRKKTSERKCSFFHQRILFGSYNQIKTALKVSLKKKSFVLEYRSDLHDFKVKELSRKKKCQSGLATVLS